MYHTIVKSIATKNFELVNERKFEEVLSGCTPDVKHRFGGSHALGGQRHSKTGFKKWFERLVICAPELKLKVEDCWVKGWPWATTVFVRWTADDRSFTFPDGRPYLNHGVHIIKMKWGKVYEIDANEDSEIVSEMLRVKASQGLPEATMAPITE